MQKSAYNARNSPLMRTTHREVIMRIHGLARFPADGSRALVTVSISSFVPTTSDDDRGLQADRGLSLEGEEHYHDTSSLAHLSEITFTRAVSCQRDRHASLIWSIEWSLREIIKASSRTHRELHVNYIVNPNLSLSREGHLLHL